jgi:hypothetical protein
LKNKAIDRLDLARRIRAAGRPIFISEDDGEARCIPCDGLRVRQTGGVVESRAIDCCGGTAFVIYLVITIKLPKLAIAHFGLELPWKQPYFYWLEDPLQIDGASRRYRFGGRDLPEFDREQVINHHADVTRILSPGDSLKGFLLGYGFESIPEEFRHGMMIPGFVIVYDQLGRDHRSPVELQAVRSHTPPRVLRRSTLLDHPDPIVHRSGT